MPIDFAPTMQRLVDYALKHRAEFGVLTPIERRQKEAAKTRVVLVARLSKDDKKDTHRHPQQSLPRQLDSNRRYAKEMGFTVVAEVGDKDATGTDFLHRPNYNRVKARVMSGELKADAFMFWMPDRFARRSLEGLLEEKRLRAAGIALKFSDYLSRDIDTSTVIGRAKLEIALAQAAYEHAVTVHRTNEALEYLKRQGVQLGTFPNYFKKDSKGRVIPTPKIHRIIETRMAGASWGETASLAGVTLKEAKNVFRYVGSKASDYLAEP